MTNSTISKSQVKEHFSSVTQGIAAINLERKTIATEAPKPVQNGEIISKPISRERMHWIQQKLSQRSYSSGYKGL